MKCVVLAALLLCRKVSEPEPEPRREHAAGNGADLRQGASSSGVSMDLPYTLWVSPTLKPLGHSRKPVGAIAHSIPATMVPGHQCLSAKTKSPLFVPGVING